jgi:hypothetical protein
VVPDVSQVVFDPEIVGIQRNSFIQQGLCLLPSLGEDLTQFIFAHV